MSESLLPSRPSLEHLKAQAKDLLGAFRADDPTARERIRPYFLAASRLGLNDVQLVIAREYGFVSWPVLSSHVSLAAVSGQIERADHLTGLAVCRGNAVAIIELLANEPTLGNVTLSAACATGNVAAVTRFLDVDPALVQAKVGPKTWEPLLYVAFSCLLGEPSHRSDLIAVGRLLLRHGADPNTHWLQDGERETCLYGATGVNDCPELALALIESGANPDDNEALYHATELKTPACLFLLLEHGGDLRSHNVLGHLLDREEPEWVCRTLTFAASPAEIPPVLSHALRRGRSPDMFRVLIASGMNLDTPDRTGLSPFQLATRLGRTEVRELLANAGCDPTLTATDIILGSLARGEPVGPDEIGADIVRQIDAETPVPTLCLLTENGNDAALGTLLIAGANPNVRDENGWTPLHHAALRGGAKAVAALLCHGADPTIHERAHNATPVGFACHGSEYNRSVGQDAYIDTIRVLIEAGGAVLETAYGSAEVQAFLVSRGARAA